MNRSKEAIAKALFDANPKRKGEMHKDYLKRLSNMSEFSFDSLEQRHLAYRRLGRAIIASSKQRSEAPKKKPAAKRYTVDNHPFKLNVPYTWSAAADLLDLSPAKTKSFVEALAEERDVIIEDEHFLVSNMTTERREMVVENKRPEGQWHRYGIISDPHLGNRKERLDVVNDLFKRFEEEGITEILLPGNWVEGDARFNTHDCHTVGMDAQIQYFLQNWPRRPGMTTYFIDGDDHEGWWYQKMGVNPGRVMERRAQEMGRDDIKYLGYLEADLVLQAPEGRTRIRMVHPGGGSSYAVSYKAQKIIEAYGPNEKPDILIIGHFHKSEYLHVRGVHCVQGGCATDQSTFMRKKLLFAALGGWIIEFKTLPNGAVSRFRGEWFPYYDNEFEQKWRHHS